MNAGAFAIPSEHAVFEGHFPDFPVVPGSVVLEHVLALWGKPFHSVARVKFFTPLGADTRVEVAFEVRSGGNTEFVCRCDTGTLCRGWIEPVPSAVPQSP